MSLNDFQETDRAISRARRRRQAWEPLWRDCYSYAMPLRVAGGMDGLRPGAPRVDQIYDATAPDAVEQLAASLLAHLTPPWSRWFGFKASSTMDPSTREFLAPTFETARSVLQSHFDRSNFAVELHQCFLDLVTVGTATLLFQEAPIGSPSAFRFLSVPQSEVLLDGDSTGAITRHFREYRMERRELLRKYPQALNHLSGDENDDEASQFRVMECVRQFNSGAQFSVQLYGAGGEDNSGVTLCNEHLEQSPFITFRWLKAAGEVYGRSPVMTALPDIKTANKVVELILKNASIAVTGIWLADDDGILNPANIRLTPGSIIPKAVGSKGLTPLQAPGRFDVSDLILEDLRARIRHVLLTDRLAPVPGGRMTATEVLERSAEMSRLIGAIFGRLQVELIVPMLRRALAILKRRGEIADINLDDGLVEIVHLSPLAQSQSQRDLYSTYQWLETVSKLGDEANAIVDTEATVRWLADQMGIPSELLRPRLETDPVLTGAVSLLDLAGQMDEAEGSDGG